MPRIIAPRTPCSGSQENEVARVVVEHYYGSDGGFAPRPLAERKRVNESPSNAEKGRAAKQWLLKSQRSASSLHSGGSFRKKSESGSNEELVYAPCAPFSPQKTYEIPIFQCKGGSLKALDNVRTVSADEKRTNGVPPLTSSVSPKPISKSSKSLGTPGSQGGCMAGDGLVVAPDGVTLVKDRRKCKPRGILTVRHENSGSDVIDRTDYTQMAGPSVATVEWVVNTSSSGLSHTEGLPSSSSTINGKSLRGSDDREPPKLRRKLICSLEESNYTRDTVESRDFEVGHRLQLIPNIEESNDTRDTVEIRASKMGRADTKDSCNHLRLGTTSIEDWTSPSTTGLDTDSWVRSTPDANLGVSKPNKWREIGPNTPTSETDFRRSSGPSTVLCSRRHSLTDGDVARRHESPSRSLHSQESQVLSSGKDQSETTPSNRQLLQQLAQYQKHVGLDDVTSVHSRSGKSRNEGCSRSSNLADIGSPCELHSNTDLQVTQSSKPISSGKKKDESPQAQPDNNSKERSQFSCTSWRNIEVDPPGNQRAENAGVLLPPSSFTELANAIDVLIMKDTHDEEFETRRLELLKTLHHAEMQLSSQVLIAETLYELAADSLLSTRTRARSRSDSLGKKTRLEAPHSESTAKLPASADMLSFRVRPQEASSRPSATRMDRTQPLRKIVRDTTSGPGRQEVSNINSFFRQAQQKFKRMDCWSTLSAAVAVGFLVLSLAMGGYGS